MFAQVDADKRLSAQEILEARWFTEDGETVNSALEVIIFDNCDQNGCLEGDGIE